jgi:hypothetical protein
MGREGGNVRGESKPSVTASLLVGGVMPSIPDTSTSPAVQDASSTAFAAGNGSEMASLVSLATRSAASHARVDELLAIVEFFPGSVRFELFTHLPAARLRELELAWTSVHQGAGEAASPMDEAAGDWAFERESQRAWKARWETASLGTGAARGRGVYHGPRPGDGAAGDRQRDYRQLFWERHVRALLKARTNALDANADASGTMDSSGAGLLTSSAIGVASSADNETELHLFADVVRSLRVHGREIRAFNMPLITALRRLRRIEVHHPEQQRTCWSSLLGLLTTVPTLRELGFFHGKLSDVQLAQVRRTLCEEETSVTGIELVSVKIRPKGFREIVALVSEFKPLEHLRLTSSVSDMDTRALVDAAVRAPSLKTLALEHNDLEDDTFQGLATVLQPISLRQLRLGNNALTASTLGAISNASLDGSLCLERLEMTNNTEVCDAGVHALTPMLASGHIDGVQLTGLQHLDLRNCEFGLEGAMNLLLALGANRSLTHLNISQNFFGTSFGDILADFLFTNDTVRELHADYVGLTEHGCTERLRMALRQNETLEIVSLAANRLRDVGACALLQPLVERGRKKPLTRVDLGGNLLTQSGLDSMARIFERGGSFPGSIDEVDDAEQSSDDNGRKRRRLDSEGDHARCSSAAEPSHAHDSDDDMVRTKAVFDELSLLNNDFAGDSSNALAVLRMYVGRVSSNEWTGKRNVYDDEV